MSIQLNKWDERVMRADDGLGFRKNWGENVPGGLGFVRFFHHFERWGLRFDVFCLFFLESTLVSFR